MPGTDNYDLYKSPSQTEMWTTWDAVDAKLKDLDDGIGGAVVVADVGTLQGEVETASTGLLDRMTAVEAVTAGATAVTGARDDPESALANLLSVLEGLGIIDDQTTETAAP